MDGQPISVGYQDFFQRSTLEDVYKRLTRSNVVILTGEFQ